MPATAAVIAHVHRAIEGRKDGEDKTIADCNAETPHSSSDLMDFGLIKENQSYRGRRERPRGQLPVQNQVTKSHLCYRIYRRPA